MAEIDERSVYYLSPTEQRVTKFGANRSVRIIHKSMAEIGPGPAFIPCNKDRHTELLLLPSEWARYKGYEWHDKTDGTMAGWVRKKGNSDKK